MAIFQNKKKVTFVKPVANKQQQQSVDYITGDRIPRSFVFSRKKLPGLLKQLQADLRKLMLPYTALKHKVNYNHLKLDNFISFKSDSVRSERLPRSGGHLRNQNVYKRPLELWESITALTFCGLGLISASEDCTVCLPVGCCQQGDH